MLREYIQTRNETAVKEFVSLNKMRDEHTRCLTWLFPVYDLIVTMNIYQTILNKWHVRIPLYEIISDRNLRVEDKISFIRMTRDFIDPIYIIPEEEAIIIIEALNRMDPDEGMNNYSRSDKCRILAEIRRFANFTMKVATQDQLIQQYYLLGNIGSLQILFSIYLCGSDDLWQHRISMRDEFFIEVYLSVRNDMTDMFNVLSLDRNVESYRNDVEWLREMYTKRSGVIFESDRFIRSLTYSYGITARIVEYICSEEFFRCPCLTYLHNMCCSNVARYLHDIARLEDISKRTGLVGRSLGELIHASEEEQYDIRDSLEQAKKNLGVNDPRLVMDLGSLYVGQRVRLVFLNSSFDVRKELIAVVVRLRSFCCKRRGKYTIAHLAYPSVCRDYVPIIQGENYESRCWVAWDKLGTKDVPYCIRRRDRRHLGVRFYHTIRLFTCEPNLFEMAMVKVRSLYGKEQLGELAQDIKEKIYPM